jgi:hypothetical protein
VRHCEHVKPAGSRFTIVPLIGENGASKACAEPFRAGKRREAAKLALPESGEKRLSTRYPCSARRLF